jgi:RimJ/RimL family protein N-acetyltransferase
MFEFKFADKLQIEQLLPDLFRILHSNMSIIAPTDNSYNEDFEIWSSYLTPAMQKEQRQMVLMYVDNKLVGYFQYYINGDTNSLMMEEIQIEKAFQGTGLFSEFYNWLIKSLPKNIMYVEAYANKKNLKSQSILKHLGLVEIGENKNGNSFYFKGAYVDLLNKYS